MKIVVACVFGRERKDIVVPCGSGHKTFKWLALTAATRFSASSPHGRLRAREAKASTDGAARCLPTNLTRGSPDMDKTGLPFLHPMDMVADHFKDMDVVTVDLAEAVLVDDTGAPSLTRWATIAFSVSDGQAASRSAALAEEQKISDDRQRENDEMRRAIRKKEADSKATTMREILRDKLHDGAEVAHSMAEDWAAMLRNTHFVDLCRNPALQRNVQMMVKAYYVPLSELFKFYAASSAGVGTSNEMEMAEYSSFLIEAAVFRPAPHISDVMHELFSHSLRGVNVKNMDRPSFLVSTIFMAWLKFIDGGRTTTNPICKKIPRDLVDYQVADSCMPLDVAFGKLVEVNLQPLIAKHGVGTVVKHALNDSEVLAMYYDHLQLLHEQFLVYSSSVSAEEVQSGVTEGNSMTLSEFGKLVEDSGLIGKHTAEQDELTIREVRQAFAGSQGEHAEEAAGQSLGHAHRMDFPEFIDAIARIGVLKWEKDDLPVIDKIEFACSAICHAKRSGRQKAARRPPG